MNILNALSEPFPKEVERELRKGGAYLTYIPVSEVITRLNKVLGVDMWSYEVLSCYRDTLDPDFVVAHVRLTANFVPTDNAPSIKVVKDGIGGQKIKRTKSGEIVDLGDEMKGAVSDALKKAAQHLGVGLYLARSEESIALESGSDPISPEYFEKLRALLNGLSTEQRNIMMSFWKTISEGTEFLNENVTQDRLNNLLAKAKSLKEES